MTAQDIKNELKRIVSKDDFAVISISFFKHSVDDGVTEQMSIGWRVDRGVQQFQEVSSVTEALSFLETVFQKKETKIEVEL